MQGSFFYFLPESFDTKDIEKLLWLNNEDHLQMIFQKKYYQFFLTILLDKIDVNVAEEIWGGLKCTITSCLLPCKNLLKSDIKNGNISVSAS